MQFYSSQFLNLLWLVPVLVVCFFASSFLSANRLKGFLKTREIQDKLLPHYNRFEWPFRAMFLLSAFILLVLALSQPQWGEEKKTVERKGVDLIFLLDVSKSMLAEDIKPSRVQKAKFEIEAFVKAFKGHRIGLLTFAGSSFMQTPLTLDYSAFLIFLSGVDVGHIPDPGTSLGAAIQRAVSSFSDEKGKQKALIVFSDGEDHVAEIGPAIKMAQERSVRIYTVGTATGEGAPIPLKDDNGRQMGVKKDRAGDIVITRLNKDILTQVASETGGLYVPATPGEKEVEFIMKHLTSLGEKKLEDRVVTEREDHYQIFVFLALLCLILEMLIRRGKMPARVSVLPVFFCLLMLNSGFLSTPHQKVEEGNQDFQEKRYQSAIEKYREVQVKNPDDPTVNYNLATSLYKVDQYEASAANLKKSLEKIPPENKALRAKTAYNYGNALFRLGDYEGAIEAYKEALEYDPEDQDAKYNIEFIQDQKGKSEKENQDRKKDNQDKKDDKNQQQNNKNQQQNQNQKQNQGGGGSSQDQKQNQGQDNQQNQQGSGQQNKDQKQNQGGQGQNQQNSGQNQGQDQKDQGQGQNQKNDDQQSGGQSEQDQQQNQGGQGQQDQQQSSGGGSGEQDEQQNGGQSGQEPDQNQGQNQRQGSRGQSGNQQSQQGQQENQKSQGQKPQPGQQQQGQGGSGSQGQEQQGGASGGAQAGGQKESQQQGQAGSAGQPLQGQMTKESAEYLLASLEEGEKKFHVMRKPAENQSENPYIEKDW